MSRPSVLVIYFTTLALVGMFFVWPIFVTVKEAFVRGDEFTFQFVQEIFRNPIYKQGLLNSLQMAVWSTLASLVLALPLAVLGTRFNFMGKSVLTALLLVPLILPPFVGAIGIKQIMGQHGALNALLWSVGLMDSANPVDWLSSSRLPGVVIMNALHLYPILYLNISAALANLDPAMDEAAENLGCSPWRRFRRVTLPLAMPGIFAGASIVFIWGFTELGVPMVLDYQRVTSVQIFDGLKDIGGNPIPYALVVVMLTVSVVIFGLTKLFLGRSDFAGAGRASMAAQTKQLRGLPGFLTAALFTGVIFLAILPHIGVACTASSTEWYGTILPAEWTSQHYKDALSHESTLPSISNSLRYAGIATCVDVFLGLGIAWIVVRTKLPGRNILDALAMLPLAVPGLVLAFGYVAMTRQGTAFHWIVENRFFVGENPILLLVIAYSMRRLPYIVRSASAGLQQTNVTLEEAAQNLGCTPLRTIRRITLPLISANLVAGALLVFAFGMLEVSDSMILAQRAEHFPITKQMYTLIGNLGNGEALASALGVWAMIFLTVTLVGASLLLGKKMGAMFRA